MFVKEGDSTSFTRSIAAISCGPIRSLQTPMGSSSSVWPRASPDDDAYYDIKDPVFDIIVEGASEWATVTAWSEPPGD